METNLLLQKVGNYQYTQGEPQDCSRCHNAHWASVIIKGNGLSNFITCGDNEGICLECLLRELLYYKSLVLDKYSDAEARAIAYEEPNELLDGLDITKFKRHKHSYEK